MRLWVPGISGIHDKGVGDQIENLDDLDRELVMLDDVAQAVDTIVAHRAGELGAGRPKLIGLDPGDLEPEGTILLHGQQSAPTRAEIILGSVGDHLPGVRADGPQDAARLADDPPGAGDVAGIVESDQIGIPRRARSRSAAS